MRLEAIGVTAGYGAKNVLEAIDMSAEAGEFVGLIGPNGCGKSTLLRVLSGCLKPHGGDVRLDGQQISRWTSMEIARRIAFVPQQEPAPFEFTVRDLVLMGRYPHRSKLRGDTEEDFAIVRNALSEVDIADLADRSITRLSGGEHRRVLLARALAQQTPLLLLDEPTAHLDITHQVALMQILTHLARTQRVGVLAALHDLNQAAEHCDRLLLIREGRIVAAGSPDAVLTTENLRTVYAADARIGPNPATGKPFIFALQPLRAAVPSGAEPEYLRGG